FKAARLARAVDLVLQQLQHRVALRLLGDGDVDGKSQREGVGVRQRLDASGQQVRELRLEEATDVRGVEQPVQVVEAISHGFARRYEVQEHEPSTATADPHHLGDRLVGIAEVV